MRRFVIGMVALGLVFGVSTQANASLIGTEVAYEYVIQPLSIILPPGSNINNAETKVVDPTATFQTNFGDLSPLISTLLDVVVDSSSISYAATGGGSVLLGGNINGPVLRNLFWMDDPTGEIIGFDLFNISSDLAGEGFDDSNVSFDAHSVTVDLVGFPLIANQSAFDIALLVSHGAAPIPEPGTLLLIGSGLVGIGIGARRRKRK